jgi:hypothetical protein
MELRVKARHEIADRLEHSLPPLEPERLDPERRALFARLPLELQALLVKRNGGFVSSDEFTFETHCPAGHDGLREIYGLADGVVPDFVSVPHDLLDARRRWAAEEFLPSGMVVIASATSDGLLCVSTNAHDHGTVYYWDYYWQYPQHAAWWQQRVNDAAADFDDPQAILADVRHPRHQALVDAANYATLVRVAGSLTEFAAATFEWDRDALGAELERAMNPRRKRFGRLFRRR